MGPETRGRHTPQQDEVRDALRAASGFVTAQQLHWQMVLDGSRVGLSTVYRQLAALAAVGDADVVSVAAGRLYRACSSAAHHHLVCARCGKAVEVPPPPQERMRAVALEHGYMVSVETLELLGVCVECTPSESDAVTVGR